MNPQPLDLEAIQSRADAAEPGPWIADGDCCRRTFPCPDPSHDQCAIVQAFYHEDGQQRRNIKFIAHAREDVPALCAEVRYLRGETVEAAQIIAGLVEENKVLQEANGKQAFKFHKALTLAKTWRDEAFRFATVALESDSDSVKDCATVRKRAMQECATELEEALTASP